MGNNNKDAMAKKSIAWLAGLVLCAGLLLTACGTDKGSGVQNSAESTSTSKVESEATTTAEEPTPSMRDAKEWKVTLPDDTWRAKYDSSTDSLELYKDGCYDSLNSSISVFVNNMSAEDSLLGSKEFSSGLGMDIKDIEYEINGVACPAIEKYQKDYDKTTVQVYYPLASEKSLQINLFVKKGSRQGVDPESGEVKQIIQSIIDENGLLAAAALDGEPAEEESIAISADGLSFEGKSFTNKNFTVIAPTDWEPFETSYGTVYVIKGGETIKDYETEPFVSIRFSENDARTALITDKKYYEDAVDLTVDVCGTECGAIRYRQEMESKPVYWEYLKVFMPVSESKSISFEIVTDSSEFEGLDITDDDVRQIIISTQESLAS